MSIGNISPLKSSPEKHHKIIVEPIKNFKFEELSSFEKTDNESSFDIHFSQRFPQQLETISRQNESSEVGI